MAKVKARFKCFIDNALREEGETFDYNGPENECVEEIRESEPSRKGVRKGQTGVPGDSGK